MSSDRNKNRQDELQDVFRGIVQDASIPVIEEEILIEIDPSFQNRRDDGAVLSRFFGICVLMIGVVTVLPSIYYWIVSSSEGNWQFVARWAYIIGFLGAVHVLYGIYTMQLVDYSALQSLSVFLLIVTCVYGFTGMSLLLDEGNGVVARFLQLPEVLKTRAMIWCGIMFGITALGCYLFGREAMFWRRRQGVRVSSGTGV